MNFNLKLSGLNFTDKLKQSFKFTWVNKNLLVLGFLASLFGGASAGNSGVSNLGDLGSNLENLGSDFNLSFLEFESIKPFSKIGESFYPSDIWGGASVILIVVGALLALVFTVLSWYVNNSSKISLIYATQQDSNSFSLKSLWSESHKHLVSVFLYSLLWIILGFVGGIALVFSIILFLLPSLCCFGLPLIIVLLLLVVSIAMLRDVSYRLLILENLKPVDSVKMAWSLIQKKTADLLLGYLFWFIPESIISGILVFISSVGILGLGLLGLIPLLGQGLSVIVVIFGVALIFLLYLIIAVINAPIKVFSENYLTNLIMDLNRDSKK